MVNDPLVGFANEQLRFVKLLGKGAMGAVYFGQQVGLDRDVAIKVINGPLAADDTYVERFTREARALGKVRHKNVISCHDHGWQEGPKGRLLVMVLEYIDGPNLESLARHQELPLYRTLQLYAQAADGLAAAHAAGIVHRDIKPANLMCTKRGVVKVADFGLAKGNEASALTQTGAIVGTPAFMAPEVCSGDDPGPGADVYSLACSLWQTITGTAPYRGHMLHVMQQHLHADPPDLSTIRPELGALAGLIVRCMNKAAPNLRPDATTFGQELLELSSTVDKSSITRVAELAATVETKVNPGDMTAPASGMQATQTMAANSTFGTGTTSPSSDAPSSQTSKKNTLLLAGLGAAILTLAGAGYAAFGGNDPVEAEPASQTTVRPSELDTIGEIIEQGDFNRISEARSLYDALPNADQQPWQGEAKALGQALNAFERDATLFVTIEQELGTAANQLKASTLDQAVAKAMSLRIPNRNGFQTLTKQQEEIRAAAGNLRLSIRAEIEVVISQTAEALMLEDPAMADALLTTIEVPDFPGFIDLIRDLALLAGKAEQVALAQQNALIQARQQQQKPITIEEKPPVQPEPVVTPKAKPHAIKIPLPTLILSTPPAGPNDGIAEPPRPTWYATDGGPQGGTLPVRALQPPNMTGYEARCQLPVNYQGTHIHALVKGTAPITIRNAPAAAQLVQRKLPNTWRLITLPVPDFIPQNRPIPLISDEPFHLAWAAVGSEDNKPNQDMLIASPLPERLPIHALQENSQPDLALLAVITPAESAWTGVNWGGLFFGNDREIVENIIINNPSNLDDEANGLFGDYEKIVILLNDRMFNQGTPARLKAMITRSIRSGSECIFVLDDVSAKNRKEMQRSLSRQNGFFVFDLNLAWQRLVSLTGTSVKPDQIYKENAIVVGLLAIQTWRSMQKMQRNANSQQQQQQPGPPDQWDDDNRPPPPNNGPGGSRPSRPPPRPGR